MTDPLANCLPGGPVPTTPPPTPLDEFFFFCKSRDYEKKTSVKKVRNLSQNAGNGQFRDSNFQRFLGEHDPRPL